MSLFKSKPASLPATQSSLAELALKNIHDGVIITDSAGTIRFINPAAITMLDCASLEVLGMNFQLLMKIETKAGRELADAENAFFLAVKTGQLLEHFVCNLINQRSKKSLPISLSVTPAEDSRIITFRDITKELEEESEQAEFISTASHEMRTPVASIEGYLSLALNPQTATIDERARGYLDAAHKSSQHLGKLFQDLLDATKLDDGMVRPNFVPTEMVKFTRSLFENFVSKAEEKKINYKFGPKEASSLAEKFRIEQVAYSSIDPNFMREILDNLIDNALKYTSEGGSVFVNARGSDDHVVVSVTDTGMGISADDLEHIFQKFYRADNSDTRTIGGTGLGLYIVKQRAEAMGGRVWAESTYGEGSTFYVSLPRLTEDEYNKRMIAVNNNLNGGKNE